MQIIMRWELRSARPVWAYQPHGVGSFENGGGGGGGDGGGGGGGGGPKYVGEIASFDPP